MELNNQCIYLIGFMGSGKTTVGLQLSEELGYSFKDLDQEIVKNTGITIPAIFENVGEAGFRKIEKKMLKELNEPHCVIATGGGVVENEGVLSWMNENGTSIYLKAPFEVMYKRIQDDRNRPLSNQGREALSLRFENRKSMYTQAEVIIDTDGKSVDEVVVEIFKLLTKDRNL
ncbi:shikimate kinase [Salipaludibacillus keqinensis]|uniref:Shikimate kinase n=1 Tax=Salipaludibacillus keqinensis TaxID=2045207 RepID=A0A323TXJ2_9BACI|nr:shikimate kinase [Salipaludibacillus keqinensis]PYZ94325.1 shikimate kinase [Salipaludibacillus keqinensis]